MIAPFRPEPAASLPTGFGPVRDEYYPLLLAWGDARRDLDAAAPGADRDFAALRLEEAAARLWGLKAELADNFALVLQWVAEFEPDSLRRAVGGLVAQVVGEQTDARDAALRGRVADLERRLKRWEEKWELLDVPQDVGRMSDV